MIKKYKKIIILISIIITIIIIVTSVFNQPQTVPIVPSIPTISITPITTPTPAVKTSYNTSEEWDKLYNQSLEEYENNRNVKAEETLAYIRQNSPIVKENFTIEYSYKNNTYTITLITSPYPKTKQEVLGWLQTQGIDSETLDNLRIQWLQK